MKAKYEYFYTDQSVSSKNTVVLSMKPMDMPYVKLMIRTISKDQQDRFYTTDSMQSPPAGGHFFFISVIILQ
jgi:hypothetical protein